MFFAHLLQVSTLMWQVCNSIDNLSIGGYAQINRKLVPVVSAHFVIRTNLCKLRLIFISFFVVVCFKNGFKSIGGRYGHHVPPDFEKFRTFEIEQLKKTSLQGKL